MNAQPDEPHLADDDGPARWVLLAGLGVLLLGLLVVALVTSLRSTREPSEQPLVASAIRTSEPSPSSADVGPSPTTTTTTTPPAPATGVAPADPAPTGEPTEPAPGGTRPQTAADAAEFSASYRPPGAATVETLTVDLESDGRDEVVVAAVVERTTRLDVARWDGREYRIVFTGRGGAAERIADLHAADVTGDGNREVWVAERAGERGASVSLWGIGTAGMTPLRADGGCADGRHTYGVIGAEVARGEIRATCDGGALPPDRWPVDVYRWDGDQWTWQMRVGDGADVQDGTRS